MLPESLSTKVKLLPMIFLIYINTQHITVFYPPCNLFYFVCLKVFHNTLPSSEVNTRGKQAHGRAVTHATRYMEGTRHWASRVLLVKTRSGIRLAFCGTYNDSCY